MKLVGLILSVLIACGAYVNGESFPSDFIMYSQYRSADCSADSVSIRTYNPMGVCLTTNPQTSIMVIINEHLMCSLCYC
jgi:hypothetical protein